MGDRTRWQFFISPGTYWFNWDYTNELIVWGLAVTLFGIEFSYLRFQI